MRTRAAQSPAGSSSTHPPAVQRGAGRLDRAGAPREMRQDLRRVLSWLVQYATSETGKTVGSDGVFVFDCRRVVEWQRIHAAKWSGSMAAQQSELAAANLTLICLFTLAPPQTCCRRTRRAEEESRQWAAEAYTCVRTTKKGVGIHVIDRYRTRHPFAWPTKRTPTAVTRGQRTLVSKTERARASRLNCAILPDVSYHTSFSLLRTALGIVLYYRWERLQLHPSVLNNDVVYSGMRTAKEGPGRRP